MVCCDSISHAEQISRISPRPTWTRSLYGSINVHGRPWDSKLLPIDYEWCCSDQLNPPPKSGHSANARVYEYTPFCNGPGDVKSPRVIVTPPSSRFCPWLALRPPHYAVRRNGEPI